MGKKKQVILTREEIADRVAEMGEIIKEEYQGKDLLVISLLQGSFIFTADLVRAIDLPLQIEFMRTSSYLDGEASTGVVELQYDLQRSIQDLDVLIVDDIIDSGNTMKYVYEVLKGRNPKSLKTCTLLDKPSRRQVPFDCDYTGFTIDDMFIVGYGLNYGNFYRNVDHIFAFVEEEPNEDN